jgi:hypothetical protein
MDREDFINKIKTCKTLKDVRNIFKELIIIHIFSNLIYY